MGKQGNKSSNRQTVKHNTKAIIISIVLASIGVVSAVYLYQYTNTAKLEKQVDQVQQELETTSNQLNSTETDKKKLNKKVKELEEAKKKLERELQAKRASKVRIAATPTAQAATSNVTGTKADWLRASGIPESQWTYVDYIVGRESGWNPCSYNPGNTNCGLTATQINSTQVGGAACGLAQSLPCGKQSKYGHWTDPVANLKWQYEYVNARYGGYQQAYSFWLSNHWY